MRTSALRGLGAMPNVFALECCIDELAERAGKDPVEYRLSITADPRARAVIEKVAAMARWKGGAPGGAGHAAAALLLPATRTAPPIPPWWSSCRSTRKFVCITCGARPMPGLVINPDGVINQLEGRHHPVGELGPQGTSPLR